MQAEDFDRLVGAIALKCVRDKFRARVADEDFDGGFHVLSGFTPRQLAGFCEALLRFPEFASKVRIQFSAQLLSEERLPAEFLTSQSAVKVRNDPYEGKLVVAAELEKDAGTSLSESDRTDIEQIRNEAAADAWIDQLCATTDVQLIEDARRQLSAALRGLFRTARSNPKSVCAFLFHALKHYEEQGRITRAAGQALASLDLPLWQKCFSAIPDAKLNQPSAWEKAFHSHATNSAYLHKRDTRNVILDPEEMRGRLDELRETQNPPLPEDVLTAFDAYIKAKGTRSSATERLLFHFDWEYVRHCFEKTKASQTADFVQKTRDVLHADDVTLTEEEDAVLDELSKQLPRPGGASEDVIDFFKTHVSSISQDPRLLSQWESLVHGTKVSCEDLLEARWNLLEIDWSRFSHDSDELLDEIAVEPHAGEAKIDRKEQGTTITIAALNSRWARSNLLEFASNEAAKFNSPFDEEKRYRVTLRFNGEVIPILDFDRMVLNNAHAHVTATFTVERNEPHLRGKVDYRQHKKERTFHLSDISLDTLRSLGPTCRFTTRSIYRFFA